MTRTDDARTRFIQANRALTAAYLTPSPDAGTIYVDMMHNSLGYLLRSLYISRSLAVLTGARLIALSGNPGVVARSAFMDPCAVDVDLAKSFGVEAIVSVPEVLPRPLETGAALQTITDLLADFQDGDRLPSGTVKALQEIESEEGIQFGRLIQDTLMRTDLQPTLYAGPRLLKVAQDIAGLDDWVQNLFASGPPAAFVSGHIDYSPWGLIMQRTLKHGGLGVYYRCDVRTPIYVLRRRTDGDTLNGVLRRAEASAFEAYREDAPPPAASAEIRSRLGYTISRNWRWTPQPSDDAAFVWPFEGSNPCVCLFTHTFTDQPSADLCVFADHLDWLERTLAHAATRQDYDLLVKVHPLDGHFDVSGSIERLRAQYAHHPNIAFVRTAVPQGQIATRCRLGLTVRGTPGIELPMRGLPVLLAGRAYFDHMPYVRHASTERDYFDAIEQAISPHQSPPVIDTAAARDYSAFDRFWAAPFAPVLGAFDPYLEEEAIWETAAAQCASMALEMDDITLALKRALNTVDAVDGVRAFNSVAKSLATG